MATSRGSFLAVPTRTTTAFGIAMFLIGAAAGGWSLHLYQEWQTMCVTNGVTGEFQCGPRDKCRQQSDTLGENTTLRCWY